MEWLNIHSSTLDSPEFVGADPVERGTWLCLLRYCIGQENGGVIAGCREWTDRRWQQLCRVTKREVGTKSALWDWKGDDLVVWAYPIAKENEVKAKRTIGRLGGRPAGSAKQNHEDNHKVIHLETARLESQETEGERKGKGKGKEGERKGKEGEGNQAAVETTAPSPAVAAPAPKARPADIAEVEAYFAAEGAQRTEAEAFWDYFEATATARGWRQANGKLITDWRAAARSWIRRSGGGPRGAAAGLAGGMGGKNFEGGGGRGVDQTIVRLPIAGLDVGADEEGGA